MVHRNLKIYVFRYVREIYFKNQTIKIAVLGMEKLRESENALTDNSYSALCC